MDIPLAYQHVGRILGRLWGHGFGSPLTEEGFNLAQRARDTVSQLSAANSNKYWEDYWERIALAAEHFRTRSSASVPDFEATSLETIEIKLTPIVSQQEAQETARDTARDEARKEAAAFLQQMQASAGQKRFASGNPTPASASTTAAPATPTGPTQPKAANSRQRKANTRAAAHQAAGGASSSSAPAAAAAPAAAPTYAAIIAPGSASTACQAASAATAHVPVLAAPVAQSRPPAPTPSWAPSSITKLSDTSTRLGAVECFNFECRRLGLGASMPCAILSLIGTCRGPPACHTCTAQGKLARPTQPPAGLVAKVKAACDANTAARMI